MTVYSPLEPRTDPPDAHRSCSSRLIYLFLHCNLPSPRLPRLTSSPSALTAPSAMNIRRATIGDLMEMQNCNIHNLPEVRPSFAPPSSPARPRADLVLPLARRRTTR